MGRRPVRDWKDGEGWTEEQLRFTHRDVEEMVRSLDSGPRIPMTSKEIAGRVGANEAA
ncbi:MAG: hypothetical protein MPJ06_09235 [Nitrosopumilus sp.]|nr:hypothetical protein [Nitrosopumilus sp.]